MAIPRWSPAPSIATRERFLLKRLTRTRKLFAFLRLHRHEIFDDAFQNELASMYRTSGAGKTPIPPAVMAMALLLQGYLRVSDAEAVELTVVDLRWQMVLDCLGAESPLFSQGALHDFRHRMIEHDMDRRLLERTVEVAMRTQGFDVKKLPRSLRVAIDSSPLEGAGKVEDTINLLAHAARNLITASASLLACRNHEVCEAAGVPLFAAPSVKAALDVDWSDSAKKHSALQRLLAQAAFLRTWVRTQFPKRVIDGPLKQVLETLSDIIDQDLEPDPDRGGMRTRQGVAKDRRISIRDRQMRHGRKSKSKRIDGYKRHIASDVDHDLILACAVSPANQPEHLSALDLHGEIGAQGYAIAELLIDRGYVKSPVVDAIIGAGGEVVCRPWSSTAKGRFSKSTFKIDLRSRTITCPGGSTQTFVFGGNVHFPVETCNACPLRAQCTSAGPAQGRTVHIAEDEALQRKFHRLLTTRSGRARLRQRVGVEHDLAHIAYRQGRRARYIGVRTNLFDLRRASAIQNLESMQRKAA